ncbi:MAG: LysR family transcriptional regulator [Sphingobium sp.]|uniref:LysR family transcriptional regulator n=1 Tax=Sphingobium sp. TaxID=1912891 RepID=UPI0029A52EFA|nr:LysR family transcriptional regulator [Sphingobium sp.]MDX3908385.1 LysR family transcriptional regulator [Sphingobium sp.]
MIDRYHLRYFLAVIDQGNFSKAAAACNVSQPTLSVGISKLEKTLGKTLFNRTNRRVELTDAGARLVGYARRIEDSFALAEHDILGTGSTVTIRIGVLVTTPRRWIENFLVAHRNAGAGERVEIIEGRERDLHERLSRGRIDVALTIIREKAGKANSEKIFTEGYSLAVAMTHPLADRAVVRGEELIHEPMIVRRHCELLSETSRYFTARGVRPFFAARTISEGRAMSYVRAGLGITVMPDSFIGEGIARPHLKDFPFTRDIGLVFAPHIEGDALKSSAAIRLLSETIEQVRAEGLHDRRTR